jgi:acylphosphatase
VKRRLHAVVRGRVQGVGFRDATAREARRLGLAGWVRNQMDGAVEITAEGDEAALRELEAYLRHGPGMAKVIGLDVFWEAAANDLARFEIG